MTTDVLYTKLLIKKGQIHRQRYLSVGTALIHVGEIVLQYDPGIVRYPFRLQLTCCFFFLNHCFVHKMSEMFRRKFTKHRVTF